MSQKPIKSKSIPTRFTAEDLAAIKALAEKLGVTDSWVIRRATLLFLEKECAANTGAAYAPRKRQGVPQRQQPSQPSQDGKSASA